MRGDDGDPRGLGDDYCNADRGSCTHRSSGEDQLAGEGHHSHRRLPRCQEQLYIRCAVDLALGAPEDMHRLCLRPRWMSEDIAELQRDDPDEQAHQSSIRDMHSGFREFAPLISRVVSLNRHQSSDTN